MAEPLHLIVEDMSPNERLPTHPGRLNIIATIELCVRDRYGVYALLTHPHYEALPPSLASSRNPWPRSAEEGQWAPPHLTYSVPFSDYPRTAGHLMDIYAKHRAEVQEQIKPDLRRYLEVLGLPGVRDDDIEEVGSFTELKVSPRTPDRVHAYHMIRHVPVRDIDLDVRSLADPEFRKGFVFLPLEDADFEAATTVQDCPTHRRMERYYLRKPLATNLDRVLSNPAMRRGLAERAIDLDERLFFRDGPGVLFCADIANYGYAGEYVRQYMGGLGAGGEEVAQQLRDLITREFVDLFARAGLGEVHMAGDGFICAVPVVADGHAAEAVARFVVSYVEYIGQVEQVSAQLREHWLRLGRADVPEPRLGTRLAVHTGPYRYGRMGLARSMLASFDGAAVIRVARLESVLREFIKGRDDDSSDGHTVLLSEDVREHAAQFEGIVRDMELLQAGLVGRAKESEVRGDVYRMSPSKERLVG